MAAPPAFSTYVALSQERQARNVELRRAAVFVIALTAMALVSLLYLNLRTRVVIRAEDVRLLAVQVKELANKNQEVAYRIAWETAPQRLEERARKLRLAPITKWEAVAVPGLSERLKAPGAAAPVGLAGAFTGSDEKTAMSPEILIAQIRSWLGLDAGASTPAKASP